jgi:hypothetical protein
VLDIGDIVGTAHLPFYLEHRAFNRKHSLRV